MTIDAEPADTRKHHLGFVLSYKLPKYIRSTTLRAALVKNPALILDDAVNESPKAKRYCQTFKKIMRIRKQHKTRLWLINFRGHEIYWPVRWLVGKRSTIIFDQLISPYDAWINERKTFKEKSLLARLVYRVEKAIMADADHLITDSRDQAQYYAELYQVPVEKFTVIRGSVDESMFSPDAPPKKYDFAEPFVIFTYGTFIPLHGMELILPVAEMLKDLPVRFMIAGGKGKKLVDFLETRETRGLTNISHVAWINFTELPSYMRGAGLCLGGPFGDSRQAKRVITGKALQFLACECPTLIGSTGETREIFEDKKNCLMVELGSPRAIADAIQWAFHHQDQLPAIARQGRLTYEKYYSMAVLTLNLNNFMDSVLKDAGKI